MKIYLVLIFSCVVFPSVASADVIVYKQSLREAQVIITKETDTDIWVRGGTEGKSNAKIKRSSIERIERWTPEENEALEKKWQKEGKEKAEEREKKEKFDEEMRARGKVKVGEEWLDPEDALKAKKLDVIESAVESDESIDPNEVSEKVDSALDDESLLDKEENKLREKTKD